MSGMQDQMPWARRARRSSRLITRFERQPEVDIPPMRIMTTHSGKYAARSFASTLGQNTGVSSLSLLQGALPTPGTEPRYPALQVDSLPAEPQGKLCENNEKLPWGHKESDTTERLHFNNYYLYVVIRLIAIFPNKSSQN